MKKTLFKSCITIAIIVTLVYGAVVCTERYEQGRIAVQNDQPPVPEVIQHKQILYDAGGGNVTAGIITLDGRKYAILLGSGTSAICPVPEP